LQHIDAGLINFVQDDVPRKKPLMCFYLWMQISKPVAHCIRVLFTFTFQF